jgi:DNA-binding NtrC family response regulator
LSRGAGKRFDAILCDLMMPEMSGMDLYAEIARAFPDYRERMVFITGGAFTPSAKTFLDEVANERLEKPFDPQGVRSLVQRLITPTSTETTNATPPTTAIVAAQTATARIHVDGITKTEVDHYGFHAS